MENFIKVITALGILLSALAAAMRELNCFYESESERCKKCSNPKYQDQDKLCTPDDITDKKVK